MKDRIQSVVALRGLAFLGIFLLHTESPIQWSNLGVATFFVLSGFLLSIRHQNEIGGEIRYNLQFAYDHIKGIYPLHIITMLIMFVYRVIESRYLNTMSVEKIRLFGRDVVRNIFLIQSWHPSVKTNISLNGVAWFLSSILFCYFMFPIIQKWIIKRKSTTLIIMAIAILLFQLVFTGVLVWLNEKEDFFRWATYDAPFFRLGDFQCGMIAGMVSVRNKMNIRYGRLMIILVIGLGLLTCVWDAYSEHVSFISKVLNNYTTIYIPIAVALVLLFSYEKRVLTNNKVLMFVGEKSNYYFLIHCAVIMIMKGIIRLNGMQTKSWWLFLTIIGGLLTVVLTMLYEMIQKRLQFKNTK